MSAPKRRRRTKVSVPVIITRADQSRLLALENQLLELLIRANELVTKLADHLYWVQMESAKTSRAKKNGPPPAGPGTEGPPP